MGGQNLGEAYRGSRKPAHASSQRSSHGRQVASPTHVQEGGQVSQREARREAPEGRGQGQDSDHAAGEATLKLCVTSPPAGGRGTARGARAQRERITAVRSSAA